MNCFGMKIERFLTISLKVKMKKIVITGICISLGMASFAEANDSIGQKFVDGKRYVEYKVDAKETLYSLSKKYNTSVAAIEASNGGLIQGLKKDATILIPVPAAGTATSTNKVETSTVVVDQSVQALHVVSTGETLYSISKQYSVPVDDLKKWNDLSSNEISLGQELKVSKPSNSKIVNLGDVSTTNQTSGDIVVADKNNAGDAVNPDLIPVMDATTTETKYTIDTSLYGEEVTETKTMGSLTKVGVDQSKNLAQMAGVKPGTILMLVNPNNNKATFVRVIEGTGDGILVTSAVKKALGLSSAVSPLIKVSYTK